MNATLQFPLLIGSCVYMAVMTLITWLFSKSIEPDHEKRSSCWVGLMLVAMFLLVLFWLLVTY